ncbi:MAG: Sensor histidine kinase RcsC [Chroococcidiopsis sp. SAG 2025]|uniref:PAS domain-containing sensor histidine kinase n=1 Tax=Chroococcidiopsis sp. SAG 2025 TaxID=171389 RepID=UPI00293731BF|nr:ATP-binding protein [Chroococcidiopsis sp. SAG 2025]MDV2993964.1 Sensor histidine kinase RcsC [Chroococcidiopsis sp. SAG 2025]
MDARLFNQKIQTTYKQAALLYKRTKVASSEQREELLEQSLEELRITLEELHVAEEEILAQNEELAIARSQVEIERQRYLDLFEFAPDGYIVTDATGKIREANRAAAKLLNVPQQFLVGKPLINYVPSEQRQAFRIQLQKLDRLQQLEEWELTFCPRQGIAFDAAVTVSSMYDASGNLKGWRWLIRDITARKQAEAAIRAVQLQNLQLQEAAKLRAHFLAIMSHELRSPLNAIVGFSQLLLRQTQSALPQTQENMVSRILNSGKHLLVLIEDILDFSKVEAGKLTLKLEPLNVVDLVIATTEEMHCLAEQKHLKLQRSFAIKSSIISNDSVRLRQILLNLLSNAIKFTEVGKVEVRVWELGSDRIAIAVEDTGIGIAPEDLQSIFQPFRQGNQTLTRQHGGTGLGLAITDSLVKMMGGKISVESKVEQGSTFYVELPRRVREQQ